MLGTPNTHAACPMPRMHGSRQMYTGAGSTRLLRGQVEPLLELLAHERHGALAEGRAHAPRAAHLARHKLWCMSICGTACLMTYGG